MEKDNVFVLTYNTNDDPTRRMIYGVYSKKERAELARQNIIKQFGNFLADTEIESHFVEA